MGVRRSTEAGHVKEQRLESIRTVFLDLDGVVWFGEQLAPGAAGAVAAMRAHGLRVCFVSNITSSPAEQIANRLVDLGVPATLADVQTPFSILHAHPYLLDNPPVLLLGNDTVRTALAEAGLQLSADPAEAQVVLLSRDINTTYLDLALAADALQNGARLLALNLDARVPSEGGRLMPGTGAIAALLSYATGVEAAAIGKPARFFFDAALKRFGADRSTTVMAGDNLDSDISGGLSAGLLTVQVGGDGFSQAGQAPVPDWRVSNIAELAGLLLESGYSAEPLT